MARLKAQKWEKLRAEYEVGASQSALAEKYGVSRTAIQKRIAKESWSQDIRPALERKVAEKVAGIVAGCNPKKRAAALNAEAGRVADVVQRHKREWNEHVGLLKDAVAKRDFDLAKLAKITSETIKIRQDGERKAWGLEKDGGGEDPIVELLRLAQTHGGTTNSGPAAGT